MRPAQVKLMIQAMFNNPETRHNSVCLEGEPGVGKTTMFKELADELKTGFIQRHLPTSLVEDFGVPYPNSDHTGLRYLIPDWFPAEGRTDIPDEGILVLDDRNQAPNDLQKVVANIIQDRTLHGAKMKTGWMVLSTGNRQQDRAGSNRVLSHLRNRETRIELEAHLDDWTEWAVNHGVRSEGIAFIRFRPNLLSDFDPQRDENATPRSWVQGVFRLIDKIPADCEFEAFKGAVGEGAAAEFCGFLKIYRKLPDPDMVIANPKSADVPDDPATLYAISSALAQRATEKNIDKIIEYTARLPGEFDILCMSIAMKRDSSVANNKAFSQWAVAHQDLLF